MLSRNEIERWHRSSSEENNMVTAITDANFAEKTKDGLVLIDFWAAWCGPCRMQTPILEKLAEEVHEDELKIFKMDVDANPATPAEFGIMSIPTLLFKKDGQVVKKLVGVHSKDQLKAIVAELS
ncbi:MULTISPECIES: thioredoxin [Streptococcus]|nr:MULTISPECIES: thioredoxin [Streptococcus]MDP1485913.1 thioredoxin [Streptococcus constellatus]